MYCSKCGKQNDDSAKFCSECGLSLQQTATSGSISDMKNLLSEAKAKLAEKANRLTKKQKTIIIAAAVVLVLVLILIFASSCGSGANSPEALAQKYVEAINSGKVEKIADCYSSDLLSYYYHEFGTTDAETVMKEIDEFYDDYNFSIYDYKMEIDYNYEYLREDLAEMGIKYSDVALIKLYFKGYYYSRYKIYLFTYKSAGRWHLIEVGASTLGL